MRATVRLARSAYEHALEDLKRPHDVAAERVGFLFARAGRGSTTTLLLVTAYEPVADDAYVPDSRVGARIGSEAIRAAMQRSLTTGEAILHVHLHDHRGTPGFSWIDERELARLVPSFTHVAPGVPHGALVLSRDSGAALVWLPGYEEPVRASSIAVVGYPMALWRDE